MTREEDMIHGRYHPLTQCKLTAGLDEKGDITVSDMNTPVSVTSTNGDVEVRNTASDVSVEMHKGDVKVSDTKGDIKISGKGGEVTVTKGTIDQIVADLRKMSYSVDKTDVENEYVFRLVVAEDLPPVSPEVDVVLPFEDTTEKEEHPQDTRDDVMMDEPLLSHADVLGVDDHIGEAGE